MTADQVRELLRARPFQSFEVRMTDGRVFQVRDPETACVTPSRLVLGDPSADRIDTVRVCDIDRCRPLATWPA